MYLTLMDSALERIDRARHHQDPGDSLARNRLLQAAVKIVAELRSTLDRVKGDPLAANLDDLCEYMSRQLMAANFHNRDATLDEVADLLREVRSAWGMMN